MVKKIEKGKDKERIHDRERGVDFYLYKQTNSEKWWCYLSYQGKVHRFTTKQTNSEQSKKYVYDYIDMLINGRTEVKKVEPKRVLMTFKECFELYFKNKMTNEVKLIGEYRKKNILKMSVPLLKFFGSRYMEKYFVEEGSRIYSDYRDWRNTKGRVLVQECYDKDGNHKRTGRTYTDGPVSPDTLKSEFTLLKSVLRYYQSNICLDKTFVVYPVDRVLMNKLQSKTRLKIPTQEEYIKIREWFQIHYPEFELVFRLGSNTGLRKGELKTLKISDVDFEKRILWIKGRKTKLMYQDGVRENTPFPLTDRIRPILEKIIENTSEGRKKTGNDNLFLNYKTGEPLPDITKYWSKMRKELNLDPQIYPNTPRKYFTSKMIKQSGLQLPILSRLLGHSNTLMLQKHYLSLRYEDLFTSLNDTYIQIDKKKQERKKLEDEGERERIMKPDEHWSE